MCRLIWLCFSLLVLMSCGAGSSKKVEENLSFIADNESVMPDDVASASQNGVFNADSAYGYVARQVAFGPRVPNTDAHRKAGDWLASELRRHGAVVTEQKAKLKAFDGTILDARNIFGQINPDQNQRILLLAHWDSRPWADKDADPEKRTLPVDGANDGASGVGVILEIARQLKLLDSKKGVDFLFVDAEDWGTDGDDESWALGTRYFVENPPIKGYSPAGVILLDMVGGKDATFCREYFSEFENPDPSLAQLVWSTAQRLGYGDMFPDRMGSAILDDHVPFIKAGIPAIDIVEFHTDSPSGFNPRWHTTRDDLSGISKETLNAVGTTLMTILK